MVLELVALAKQRRPNPSRKRVALSGWDDLLACIEDAYLSLNPPIGCW